METPPLISILLPVRDPAPWLDEAIASLLTQTLADFELLLIGIDDRDSWRKSAPPDQRVRYINRPAAGIVSALNEGLQQARGHYIARMDSDDICHPRRLEQQLLYLKQHPDVGIAGCLVEIFSDAHQVGEGSVRYQKWLNGLTTPDEIANNIFVESPLPHPGWFMHRHVALKLGGYRASVWAEDYDFLLRGHQAGIKMGKPEEILLQWREHTQRLTRTDTRYNRTNFIEAKAWALSEQLLQNREAIIIGTGRNAVRLHDALQKRGNKTRYFVDVGVVVKGRTRRHLPVIDYERLLKLYNKEFLIISIVSYDGAGMKMRQWLKDNYLSETKDFVIAG